MLVLYQNIAVTDSLYFGVDSVTLFPDFTILSSSPYPEKMSAAWVNDLAKIAKGIEVVLRAGVQLQNEGMKQIWLNSSVRSLNEELCKNTVEGRKKILEDPSIISVSSFPFSPT